MNKDELIATIRSDFSDLLNNSEIKTTDKAKEIAHGLLQQGFQPTWRLIREVLGTGSATTLQNVVNNYWVELSKRLNHLEKRADIPSSLAQEFNILWDKALKKAQIEIEIRLKKDFAEAATMKEEITKQYKQLEMELAQLKIEKNDQEKQYEMENKTSTEIIQQLNRQLEQQHQETEQLKERYQQIEMMSEHQQLQVKQLTLLLNTTKQDHQQIIAEFRSEQQQTLKRQAQQYESMIDHYANELGQLKVASKKQKKQHEKERVEWQKQQKNVTSQLSQLQVKNAILQQGNQHLKKQENFLQQRVESQQKMLSVLEKEQAALQTRCTFIAEDNILLKEKLNKG